MKGIFLGKTCPAQRPAWSRTAALCSKQGNNPAVTMEQSLMCGENREGLGSPWLWSQPVSISPLCHHAGISWVSTGLAFGPGLDCCQPGNLPLAQTLRDTGTEPSRAPSCPQEGRGVFPLLLRLPQQHVANRTDLEMNWQASAAPTSPHWDCSHSSANSLLPKPALLLAGALRRWVASGIKIPLEADAAFPGFDADRQWQQNLTNNKYNPCLCCCKEFNSRWKPRKSFERFLPTKS